MIFALNIYLLNTVFYWFNPEYNEIETNKKLVFLNSKVDSLNSELRKKDLYAHNLYRILSGKPGESPDDSLRKKGNPLTSKHTNIDSLTPVDVRLRKEIEQKQGGILNFSRAVSENAENYFVRPADGVVLQKFNPAAGNLGMEIATKSGEIVKAIAEGVVIWSNFSDEGHVIGIQHKNGFISVYKGNTDVLKVSGENVNAGEGIAIAGRKKESSESRVYFELWKEGSPVNPEHFISF